MTEFEAGTGIADITAFKKGIGMMGYGMYWNTVQDVETPLYARAYVFRHSHSGKTSAVVVCDIAFVSLAIKSGVLKKLARKHAHIELHEANLLMTAQHTHSGPGGYNHYGLYNITIPGFVPEVYQAIVEGITTAIVQAWETLRPARLYFDTGSFDPEIDVAFNRSMKSFSRNPEAKDYDLSRPELAVDREMKLLRIDAADGTPIGAINWFGVHATSVHNDNHSICWDNKGYAAEFLEQELREKSGNVEFLGAFAQGTAGDVTPNYVYDKKKKWTRGPYEDDFESARYNGRLQYELASKIFHHAPSGHEISGDIDYVYRHVNFANVLCDPEFTGGQENARTVSACHGVAFFKGTVEGPGMEPIVAGAANFMAWWVKQYDRFTGLFKAKHLRRRLRQKYAAQGKKSILIEAGERRVLGTGWVKGLIVPGFADPTIKYFKRLHPRGWDEDKPWVPHVLPIQILVLGDLALVGVPAETTTIAGQRIRKTIEAELFNQGIKEVVISPYANSYCGYITTWEEYQVQAYEGGHTVYGHWTLAAFQTTYRELARSLAVKRDATSSPDDIRPPEFSKEELQKRAYNPSMR